MEGRLLKIHSLSQGNGASVITERESQKWCGRTSSAMVYNYYVAVGGQDESHYVVNDQDRGDLFYPGGRRTYAAGYVLMQGLQEIKPGWERRDLVSGSLRSELLSRRHDVAPSQAEIDAAFSDVVESLRVNNPIVLYAGLSLNLSLPRHIVVVSGYRIEGDGSLWLHIDDPARANRRGDLDKVELVGEDNIEVVTEGVWNSTGATYWIRAARLLQTNEHTKRLDLVGDHADSPGLEVFINLNPTPDSPFAVDLGNGYARGGANASLPLDLGDGLALAADAVEAAYAHVETGGRGGWYPVGDNTIWHGGVHLRPDPDDPAAPRTVHACLPGRVVAARLGAGDAAEGPFGSRNFVLVRHEAPAPPDAEDGASSAGDTPSPAAEPPPFYSLYMHLAPLADDRSGPAQAGASTETLRTTTRVNYRSAPAMDASLVVGTAPRQTRVERLPEAAQAARNTDAFAWSRVHLAEGAVEAYVTTDPQYVERAGPAPVTVEAVSWLQKVSPETFETTTGLNYRSAPVVRDETWLGTAEKGTRVEPLSDAPQAALETGHFRWARIHLSSGPVEAFISTNSQYVRSTRTSELDTDLLDRLATGEVVAVDREVGAGDVLWTVGTHGLRSLPDDPLPETLHWEMISESNLVADLCRPVEPDVSGDGQAGSPPTSRVSPPLSSRTVLVRRAEGPSTVEAGQPATFRAADFNVSPTPDERARVNWEVRAGDAVVATFRSAGDRLVYTPPVALAGETIEVRPFARSSTAQVSVRTRVEAPPPWWAAEDPDADFQTDAAEVLGLFERLDTTILGTDLFAERVVVAVEARREGATPARPSLERDTAGADPAGHLAHDELATFYTADVGGRATRLRHAACRFVSEWGVSDVPAAVAALGVGAPEATAKAVERHQWWAEAVAAGAGLPAEPRLWHYHPLSLLVHIAGSLAETESPDADGGGDQTVVWGQRVSPEFKSRVLQMSDTLQIDADYLMAIMAFESAETFSPSIWNQAGSRAVGLIQFMDGAASEPDLNTTLEALEAMTAVEQLDYVERYFRMRQRQFGKITTLSDVYMAVLRPANIGDPESAVLFRAGTTAYRQNDGLDSDGNGEITKAECAAKVQEKLERGERFRG